MKFPRTYTLREISELIDSKCIGTDDFPVDGMNEIHVVTEGDIVFVDHPKYYDKALKSAATVVLINKNVECPEGKALLISDDPFRDFNKLLRHFKPFEKATSAIADSAKIGEGTIIQPNCFIGNNVTIGKNCLIHSNVSIYDHCVLGDNVIIHAGTVLGANGFYYKKRAEGFDRLESAGRVVIENNVEIGALCSIDRGVTADTTIGEGSKLDNQIQIGHDTIIGKKCLIASQTGIAGCVVVEDNVTMWGQVGVNSGVTIQTGSVVLGQTGVTKSLKTNAYWGTPAQESRSYLKDLAQIKNVADLAQEVKELKKKIDNS